MNFTRIYALVLRHLYIGTRSLSRLTDTFWWPFVDLLLWGLMTTYIRSASLNPLSNLVLVFLSGLILWTVIYRMQWEIGFVLNEEVWSRNLLNLLASPLTQLEFMVAALVLSLLKLVGVLFFMFVFAYFLFRYNILAIGFYFIPFIGLLGLFAWAVGLLVNSLIIRLGRDAEALAWTAVFLTQPFSCIFYPLSFLPGWAQTIALLLPPTYIFEAMRSLLFTGTVVPFYFWMALFLSLVHLALAIFVFGYTFEKAKELGLLSRLLE